MLLKYKKVFLIFILLLLLTANSAYAEAEDFKGKLSGLKWVDYSPTNCNPEKDLWPTDESIREDLAVLREAGFDGLVTYSSKKLSSIYQIAREAGFKGLIAGVWDPNDKEEIGLAVDKKDFIDAYCIGNEGLLTNRYTLQELSNSMEEVRSLTGKPVTTSEPVNTYFTEIQLQGIGDWLFPIIHPWWAGIREPGQAAEYTVEQYTRLAARTEKPLLIKETGLPTAGDPVCSEENQVTIYSSLEGSGIPFVYFEGFDQEWKITRQWVERSPIETHWGVFTAARQSKTIAQNLIIQEGLKNSSHAWFILGRNYYYIEGNKLEMDAVPFMQNDRVFVPLRFLTYAVGLSDENLKWDETKQAVILNKDGVDINLYVGDFKYVVNGIEKEMDVFPLLLNDRVYIPARFVAQEFGFKVEWDGRSVYLSGTRVKQDYPKTVIEKPAIELVSVPPYGSFENLKGVVKNISKPDDYKIAVYILVNGRWWTKPYASNPLTDIEEDGSFECDITTGGVDEQATKISVYLLPAEYSPPLADGDLSLPLNLEDISTAKAEVSRNSET